MSQGPDSPDGCVACFMDDAVEDQTLMRADCRTAEEIASLTLRGVKETSDEHDRQFHTF